MRTPVSIVTTCKGRLHHLKQTLPSMIAQGAEEVVVVDYDCPDGTGDWVAANHPSVSLVRVRDRREFSAAGARNRGAAVARAEWLAFVDADCILRAGWIEWLRQRLPEAGCFFVAADGAEPDLAGAVVCRTEDFRIAGRYDEAIPGCGSEDIDLRKRLRAIGLRPLSIPSALMHPIRHSNDERTTQPRWTVTEFRLRNELYLRAKEQLSSRWIGLDECCRKALLETASRAVQARKHARVKSYYPFRFCRYCPACAERMSANMELVLHRRAKGLFSGKSYFLVRSREEARSTAGEQQG